MTRRAALAAALALAAGPLAHAAAAEPTSLHGVPVARVAVTLVERAGAIHLPGPFAVLPDGRRIAVTVPEAGGILLVESDRILHHFPLPADAAGIDDLAASPTLLVAGRRLPDESAHVDLVAFDLETGRFAQRIRSTNPYLRPPGTARDRWRIVVENGLVGVFEPTTAATYPLWDRAEGVIAGGEQVVRSTAGLGFGAAATWIPNPDGSVDRKTRGRAEPFVAAGEGEFAGGHGDSVVVLLRDGGRDDARSLPRTLVVRVVAGEGPVAELRLDAMSDAVDDGLFVLHGRPVHLRGGRLYWPFLGPDYLEFRTAALPATGG